MLQYEEAKLEISFFEEDDIVTLSIENSIEGVYTGDDETFDPYSE